jgi:hypothetical protein
MVYKRDGLRKGLGSLANLEACAWNGKLRRVMGGLYMSRLIWALEMVAYERGREVTVNAEQGLKTEFRNLVAK